MTLDTDRLRALSRLPAFRGNMCVDGCLHCVKSPFPDYQRAEGVCHGKASGRSLAPSDADSVWTERGSSADSSLLSLWSVTRRFPVVQPNARLSPGYP
jgi:hypothetical protein